jgi:ubiquinone/menaquinone biosynthesis C-methylase UbiE
MNNIANYDTLNYDYRQYWKNREYENGAERIALENLLKNESGNWFIDIGGSFGRLTPTYYKKYKNCIILDYSLKTLQNNYEYIRENFPNTVLISANAYHLPFKDNTFDAGLMVRVLHHIEKPMEYFIEAYRVFNNKSVYIQEYANKMHIKAMIKGILHLDFSVFSKDPYQQPTKENYEGARKGSYVPFFNYHPIWIKDTFEKTGFKILSVKGCSFFRINFLKRIFNTKLLLFFEKIAQSTLSWSNTSPSIFVKSTVEKEHTDLVNMQLEDILQCPKCHGKINIEKNSAVCRDCKKEYLKKENIWDFRV